MLLHLLSFSEESLFVKLDLETSNIEKKTMKKKQGRKEIKACHPKGCQAEILDGRETKEKKEVD